MINRRRAPSSSISSEKKLAGHENEHSFANMIGGKVIPGTGKPDITGLNGEVYSVKSGKKWQVFLYSFETIKSSNFLKIFSSLQEAYPIDSSKYFQDREKVISYKENYGEKKGKEALKLLSNKSVSEAVGSNLYIQAKEEVQKRVPLICEKLKDETFLINTLEEAFFKNDEVRYLAIKDTHYLKDNKYKIFHKDDVIKTFAKHTCIRPSGVGKTPVDFNVAGQKICLDYKKNGKDKNLCHFEMRVSGKNAYRLVLLNMHGSDALNLLTSKFESSKSTNPKILLYGKARDVIF